MDFGAFVGVGYILTDQEREDLMGHLADTNPERYNDIMDNMYCYDGEDHWFFGDAEPAPNPSVQGLLLAPVLKYL